MVFDNSSCSIVAVLSLCGHMLKNEAEVINIEAEGAGAGAKIGFLVWLKVH